MKTNILCTLPCLCALLLGAPVAKAEDKELGIREALALAIEGNVDLKKEKVAIQIADANLLAAHGRFDLTLTGNTTFSQRTTPSVAARDIASGISSRVDLGLGLLRQLETGGRVSINFTGNGDQNTNPILCDAGKCIVYDVGASLRFDQPLLRDFGSDIALATLRRRRIEMNVAQLNREVRVSTVLRDVAGAYWELAFASRDLEIRRSAVALAQKQLEATEAQIQVGRLAPIDRAAVERAIADRQQEVVNAEQNLFFRGLVLRRLAGQPLEINMARLVAAEMPNADPLSSDAAAYLARALEHSPQLRSMKTGLELSEIDILTVQNLLKPQLDAFAQLGNRGRSLNFDEALTQVAGTDNLTWMVGLNFSMPLQNRAARGQTEVARATRERSWLDAQALELDIRDSVIRFSTQIDTAARRLELARKAVGFAQQSLKAEEAKFAAGNVTNNDVLLRQQELNVAESQIVRATVDLMLAEIQVQAVTGDLLDRYGVSLTAAR
jgi:outer membrane protein